VVAGVVYKEVPGQALADGINVDGWRYAVGGFRGVYAAQPGRLAHWLRPQVLVHRVHGMYVTDKFWIIISSASSLTKRPAGFQFLC
jgi:hypothetical protein